VCITASRSLPARCLDTTTLFYEPLGFLPVFREDLPGGHLVLHREGTFLPFVRQPRSGGRHLRASVSVAVDDVERCHAELGAALPRVAARWLGTIHATPAGREFALTDPDGSLVRVCERGGQGGGM
jgi:hypothetical protein